MAPVAVATIASSMILMYVFFLKKIPKNYDTKLVDIISTGSTSISRGMLKVCLGTLVAIDVGYVAASLFRVPVSVVICSGAVFLLAVYLSSLKGEVVRGERKGLIGLAKDINWDIVLESRSYWRLRWCPRTRCLRLWV